MIADDPARKGFYEGLVEEVEVDQYAVNDEFYETSGLPSWGFGVWQYHNLDRDGGTKKICQALERGEDIFREPSDDIVREYGHWAPPGYFAAARMLRLMEWEAGVLDDAAGGTTSLQQMLEGNCDPLEEDTPEGKDKYAHLIPDGWEPTKSRSQWCSQNYMDPDHRLHATFVKERYMHI